jgi:DNA-binding beta-propeller fold protein YncE
LPLKAIRLRCLGVAQIAAHSTTDVRLYIRQQPLPISIRYCVCWLCLFCSFCLFGFYLFFFPATAHADGGAPNLAYVAGSSQGISAIDVLQRRVTRTISLPGDPSTVLLSADGSILYTTQPAQGKVVLLDAGTGKVRCTASVPGQPSLLALGPEGDVLYVAGQGDTHVRVLDAHSCALQQTFQAGGSISGLAITLVGGAFPKHTGLYQLWAATPAGLTVFDTNGTVLDHFSVAGAQHLCYATGFALYVTTSQGTVVAIDLALHKVTPPLLQSGSLGSMDYNAATGEIYVPDLQHHQIVVLSPINPGMPTQTGKIVQHLPMTAPPVAIAITSDGQLGFVALLDGHVVMLDIPGRRVVTTFTVGGRPHFIITGLYPPVTTVAPSSAQTSSPSSQSPWWRIPLLVLFITIFCLALFTLIYLLFLWWKRKAS